MRRLGLAAVAQCPPPPCQEEKSEPSFPTKGAQGCSCFQYTHKAPPSCAHPHHHHLLKGCDCPGHSACPVGEGRGSSQLGLSGSPSCPGPLPSWVPAKCDGLRQQPLPGCQHRSGRQLPQGHTWPATTLFPTSPSCTPLHLPTCRETSELQLT